MNRLGVLLGVVLLCGVAFADDAPQPSADAETPMWKQLGVPEKVDETTVHPAFRLTAAQVQAYLDKGVAAARKHKTAKDVLEPAARMPQWVGGRKGRVHESRVFFDNLNGLAITAMAWSKASRYEEVPLPRELRDGPVYRTLSFLVNLASVPFQTKPGTLLSRNKVGNADDVEVVAFALEDDKGHILRAGEPVTIDQRTGSVTFGGVDQIPHTITGNSTATATGPGGTVYGYGRSVYTVIESVPWSVNLPYYRKVYRAWFPLYDKDGKALIGPDVKQLTLHIVTRSGEQQVVYKLPSGT